MASYLTLLEQLSTAVDQLNQVLQGDENTTVTINGQQQPSVQKKTLDEVNAKIQLVLDAAADIDAVKYATSQAGIENTISGQFFSVVSGGDNNFLDLYENDSGNAILRKSYPNVSALNKINEKMLSFSQDFSGEAKYIGAGSIIPLLTDRNLKVLLGYDQANNIFVGSGLIDIQEVLNIVEKPIEIAKKELLEQQIKSAADARYNGSEVVPLLTDKNLKVLLGYDQNADKIIGAGLNSNQQITIRKKRIPLQRPLLAKAINQVIAYGQSLSVGAAGKPALSILQPYSNLTFNGGPRAFDGLNYDFLPLKPLVEDENKAPDGSSTRGETVCSGFANYTSTLLAESGTDPDDHVILASAAGAGGYRIDQLEKGTSWYENTFLQHMAQANAANNDHSVQVILWLQGENDASYSTTSTEYKNKVGKLIDDINLDATAITLQESPVYMLEYQTAYWSLQRPDISLAQLELAKTHDRVFMVSPTYHMPHASDRIHLTNVGYKWLSGYFSKGYKALIDGFEPDMLKPISATARGYFVHIKFDVPYLPLILDDMQLSSTTDYGFAIEDANGLLSISSIKVDGDNVVIELQRPIVGTAEVRYALDYQSSLTNMNEVGTGNLRDSDPAKIIVDGVEKPLFNVSPHFKLNIIKLGE